jgi:hypothetical protein
MSYVRNDGPLCLCAPPIWKMQRFTARKSGNSGSNYIARVTALLKFLHPNSDSHADLEFMSFEDRALELE